MTYVNDSRGFADFVLSFLAFHMFAMITATPKSVNSTTLIVVRTRGKTSRRSDELASVSDLTVGTLSLLSVGSGSGDSLIVSER